MEDSDIRQLIARLGRRHSSGGLVVERAAILAEGVDVDAVLAWITAHGGVPEEAAATATRHGLHGSRLHDDGGTAPRAPARFVFAPGALD